MDHGSFLKLSSLLRPISTHQSQHYDCTCISAQPSDKLIPETSFTLYLKQKSTLPPDWSSHIQSKGQLYFYNRTTRIVTEANVHDVSTLERICRWSLVLYHMVRIEQFNLPPRFEIFLELEEGDCDACNYYLVDHDSQTEFWLQDVNSDEVFGLITNIRALRMSIVLLNP
ncbi:hypothetical protein BD410DRAFT_491692 [Rickenella mellea]|uniref:WW domain-containing protein n=1 Tax=Rickenella mellea TaxID=50990 RepID=A0A4Y7PUH2_9AGAM|nr:hypothetical protein BD410DRAFT_491692 [Rickenella mellea]